MCDISTCEAPCLRTITITKTGGRTNSIRHQKVSPALLIFLSPSLKPCRRRAFPIAAPIRSVLRRLFNPLNEVSDNGSDFGNVRDDVKHSDPGYIRAHSTQPK